MFNFSQVKMMGAADKQVESLRRVVYDAIKIQCDALCFELGTSTHHDRKLVYLECAQSVNAS
jgi:hypothetical protein